MKNDPAYPASTEFHSHSGMTIHQTVAMNVLCSLIEQGIFSRMGDKGAVKRAFEVADEFCSHT